MSYETAIKVDSEVHQYLFGKKERPSEPFNVALRRELGMPAPDAGEADSEADNETTDESTDPDDRTEVSA